MERSRRRLRRSEWLLFLMPLVTLGLIFGTRQLLSAENQAAWIIRHIRYKKILHAKDPDYIGYLVKLGPPAHDLVLAELNTMQQHPERYRDSHGYVIFFRTLARAGDQRALPYLYQFETDPNGGVRSYAHQSRIRLEAKLEN
jgi:hypothetical protein